MIFLSLLLFLSLQSPTVEESQVLEVRVGSELFTKMHYGDSRRVPFLWPVFAPGDIEVTRAYPMKTSRDGEAFDHPHHTSLWFAHGDVNGHDFWHSKGRFPRIDVDGEPEASTEVGRTVVESENLWRVDEDVALLKESRTVIFAVDGEVRTIDFDLTLEALDDVCFGDTKEGTFALRLHPALRLKGEVAAGHARDSEKRVDGDLWGERSRWLTYYGPIDGKDVGVAVFDHTKNLRHPTWWHARDYGLVAANPFGIHGFEGEPAGTGDLDLARGDTLRLRYRVLLYAGAPDFDALEEAWREWSSPAETKGADDESDFEPHRDQ